MFSLKKDYFKLVLVVLLVVIVYCGLNLCFNLLDNSTQTNSNSQTDTSSNSTQLVDNGITYKQKRGLETWLLLGVDKYKSEIVDDFSLTGVQTDYMILIVFDKYENTYSIININRDTMTDVNILSLSGENIGSKEMQITLAYTYSMSRKSSAQNTIDAVSNLLHGVDIDNAITFTLDTVPAITDVVGGVTVNVPEDFANIDSTMPIGDNVLLTGDQALNFVQTRRGIGNSTNIERMGRQQEFIEAFIQSYNDKKSQNSDIFSKIYELINDYMYTDSNIKQLNLMVNKLNMGEQSQTYQIEGEAVVGDVFMEFYPDEEKLKNLVLEVFYEKVE